MKKILIMLAIAPLAACGADNASLSPEELESRSPISNIDFGTDDGEWSNDNECDDPRFKGPGMTGTPLLEEDIKADATDCREAYERGELTLIE